MAQGIQQTIREYETVAVHILPAFSDNYIYLVRWDRNALVVDPGDGVMVLQALRTHKLHLQYILLTHHHADHIGGLTQVKSKTHCEVLGPAGKSIPGLDRALRDGDQIRSGPVNYEVMATPGHGSRDVSFYAADPGILFCGDTLFSAGCGRLFEGTPETMWHSLNRLAGLPDATEVYCGHEYTVANLQFAASQEPGNSAIGQRLQKVTRLLQEGHPSIPSTMAQEKTYNPFLRADTVEMRTAMGMPDASAVEVFAELRRRKDHF